MGNAACVASGAAVHGEQPQSLALMPSLGDGGEITPSLNKICMDSWELLTGDTCASVDVIPNFARLGMFSAQVLQRLNEYPEVFAAFRPRTNRQHTDTYSRYILMYRLIRYMLSVKDSSLKIKQQLRLMGRNHMRIGVTEEHTRIFCQVLLITVEKQLGHYGTKKVLSAWKQLLNFIMEQFFFDKITFIGHFTQDPVGFLAPVAAMHRNSDQMLSECGSVQSSVNLYRQNEEDENEQAASDYAFSQPVEVSSTECVIGNASSTVTNAGNFFTDLSVSEEALLGSLDVPVCHNEIERILTLRQTRLLDSTPSDPEFNSFATLGAGSFGVSCQLKLLFNILFVCNLCVLSVLSARLYW
jgi:hemoglobin-like flavoprotein